MSGLGQSSQQTSQTQQAQSTSNPWQPAQPLLQNILSGIGGNFANLTPTSQEQSALNAWMQNAQGIPNYSGQASSIAGNFMSGDPTGLLGPAYQQYQQTLNPIANAPLNPMQTPGFSNALNTMNQDITNQVNGEFAGAGRSGSGLNTQALARGISQGDSSAIANQYNQNVQNTMNAGNNMFTAAGQTAGAMNTATGQGLGIASSVPQFAGMAPQAQLAAGEYAQMLPMQLLGSAENLAVPIAGLGGQTNNTGSSQGQTTNQASPLQMMLGMFGGGANSAYNGLSGAAQGVSNGLSNLNLGGLFGGSSFFPNF